MLMPYQILLRVSTLMLRLVVDARLAHGLSMSPLIFVHIRLRFHYFWALYLGLHNVGKVP